MTPSTILHKRARNLLGGAAAIALLAGSAGAYAQEAKDQKAQLDIPAQPLASALKVFSVESDSQVLFNESAVAGRSSPTLKGKYSRTEALALMLKGTDLRAEQSVDHVYLIKPVEQHSEAAPVAQTRIAEAAPARAAASVETVVVTSSKIKGDIQTVPIAITALSQEQLTSRQIAGGPDLVKEVPNLTFSKTNFTGYNIQIRGIGTQAISVTTDPAVAVALNDIPFIRNHFFEQEFFDVSQVEVLRGPQGTLYGRNATAGVVNVVSAKPTDQFEAMVSADFGNYHNRRYEGMVNIPIVDDRLDLRVAGEWTKRDGYSFNATTNQPVDGRDLWSARVSIGFRPISKLQTNLVWEHFQEDDDRMRTAKQLCQKDPGPSSVDGLDLSTLHDAGIVNPISQTALWKSFLSQGCLPASFYSSKAYETPNGQAIPFVFADEFYFTLSGDGNTLLNEIDPYANKTQSRNLRVIESDLSPTYHAKNDTVEFNADFALTPTLTLTSQTGYNKDQLISTEDFNRFNTAHGLIAGEVDNPYLPAVTHNGVYCDPQVGCSDKLVAEDLSREHAWQFYQELRIATNFSGPLNFSFGANYMKYHTVEDYFVFANLLTLTIQKTNRATMGDFTHCYAGQFGGHMPILPIPYYNPFSGGLAVQSAFGCNEGLGPTPGTYIDPNPLSDINGLGHNYFRSENPYLLNSNARFGEAYYQVTKDVKLTAGLRWTDDKKKFWNIPSWVFLEGGGYPVVGIVNQEWNQWTGRFNATWTPKLDFTQQSMFYASVAHGYKGGGANPPPPVGQNNGFSGDTITVHPATFNPEFINAYELGTKNTLLDGSMTLNGDVFYYDYKGYQISQIVDRSSVNLNFDANVKGAELEASWEPLPGLRFNLASGYEDARVNKGQSAIDLMDRTAGHPGWLVVKPFMSETSNCIFPAAVIRNAIETTQANFGGAGFGTGLLCDIAYNPDIPAATRAYEAGLDGISGYDPSTEPGINHGEGFAKDLSGNELPNAPHFTSSLTAEYTMPVSEDWAATLHSDFYWQSQSFARIFNDRPYDKLRGYSNVNLALVLTSANGWQAAAYLKNVFNTTAITGAFLNSDDTGLTTNVFLTDPRLFGVRVTKNW